MRIARHTSASPHRHWGLATYLPGLFVTALLLMVTIDSVAAVAGSPVFDGIQQQVDVTAGRNLATLLAATVLALVGVRALGIARRSRQLIAAGWALTAVGAMGLAIAQLLELRPGKITLLIAAIFAAVPVFLFFLYELRGLSRAWPWLAVGLLLILSNPATEYAETRLTGNPENYSTAGFDHDAWIQLWIITHVQEVTETGSMICVLAAVQLKRDSLDDPEKIVNR